MAVATVGVNPSLKQPCRFVDIIKIRLVSSLENESMNQSQGNCIQLLDKKIWDG